MVPLTLEFIKRDYHMSDIWYWKQQTGKCKKLHDRCHVIPKDRGKFAMGNSLQSKLKLNLANVKFLAHLSLPKLSDFCSKGSTGKSTWIKKPTPLSYSEVMCSLQGPDPSFEFVPMKAAEYF
jgi:hypothetical protein